MPKISEDVADGSGIRPEAVDDTLGGRWGDAGAAQPLILVSHVLERATPCEVITSVAVVGECE